MFFMNVNENRLFYYIGTGLLLVALFEVTILPYIIMCYFPSLFIPVDVHRRIVGGIYILAFLFYAANDEDYLEKMITLFVVFMFYVFLQILFQQVGNF